MMQKHNKIPPDNPFKVPENYFEEVNKKIISANTGDYQKKKEVGLYLRLKPYLIAAAAFIGVVILSYTAVKLILPGRQNNQMAEVIYEVSQEMYMNDLDILMLEQSAADLNLFDELPEINDSDIIDYLLLENIEINDIYEQL